MSDLAPLREVMARHDLTPRRSLGQNFLLDLNLTGRIARAAGDLTKSTVIEIGPGPGGLTRALLDQGARRVIAIETDRRCIAALGDLVGAYPERLRLVEANALEVNLAALIEADEGRYPVKLVANLPYNIATPLLLKWLHQAGLFTSLTLMFQKEVALRLVAQPRSKAYGRLSVVAQWLCEVKRLFDIAPSAFVPPPSVVSTLVQLSPRPMPLAEARMDYLERVTAAAFGQRRKMLRSSLKSLNIAPETLLASTRISPMARAEELEVTDFCALARALEQALSPPNTHSN